MQAKIIRLKSALRHFWAKAYAGSSSEADLRAGIEDRKRDAFRKEYQDWPEELKIERRTCTRAHWLPTAVYLVPWAYFFIAGARALGQSQPGSPLWENWPSIWRFGLFFGLLWYHFRTVEEGTGLYRRPRARRDRFRLRLTIWRDAYYGKKAYDQWLNVPKEMFPQPEPNVPCKRLDSK